MREAPSADFVIEVRYQHFEEDGLTSSYRLCLLPTYSLILASTVTGLPRPFSSCLPEAGNTSNKMCVNHFVHYLHCGHHIPDVQANINDRCDAVSAALIFYHEQPSYEPLDEPLILPRTCEPVKARGGHISPYILRTQASWDRWMIAQFESNGFGFHDRRNLMNRALGAIAAPERNMYAPYPANQVRQYNALIAYQSRPVRAPNRVFATVASGCGRGTKAKCHGRGAPPASAGSSPPPPSPPTGPTPSTDERYLTARKPSSSLPELDSTAMAGDEVRKKSLAVGLEQMPVRAAASSFEVLKRAQIEDADEPGKSDNADFPGVSEDAD